MVGQTGLLTRLFELMLPAVRLANEETALGRRPNRPFIAPQPRYRGVSFGYFRFYVTNAEPSIRRQLEKCLRHYHAQVKGRAFWEGEPVNFVTGGLGAD